MKNLTLIALSFIFFISCQNDEKAIVKTFQEGRYLAHLQQNDSVAIPFVFTLENNVVTIYNGGEEIICNDLVIHHDSIWINIPVFNSAISLKASPQGVKGFFTILDKADYLIPITAEKSELSRFSDSPENYDKLEGKYKTHFMRPQDDGWIAMGDFSQSGNKITGTFKTNSGDYRFLEGQIIENQFEIYGFDGITAYSFIGRTLKDSIFGTFFSGQTGVYPFAGVKDSTFTLADPTTLTQLLPDENEVHFSFPLVGSPGEEIKTNTNTQKGQVTIIQISGSWCHNCMDETRFLVDQYNRYHESGLDIIGVCFERHSEFEKSAPRIQKMIDDLSIPYPMAFAGKTGAENTSAALPMFSQIVSYPTSIYIDKKGVVRKIHTGFTGPGTKEYEDFIAKSEKFIQELLSE